MKIAGVISLRNILNENYREIVYEWEDIIAEQQNGILINVSNNILSLPYKIMRKMNYHKKMQKINAKENVFLAFCMNTDEVEFYRWKNIIPVFIDVWPKDLAHFYEKVGDNFAIVTSLDIYELVKPLCHNVYYMPLCISDKWKMNKIPEKSSIIVQLGRNNHILHKYALKFVQEYPEYEYIYADYNETTKQLTYFSTHKGQINALKSRNDYMKMLNRAAVCILSSPGIDKSRKAADGIDYPTPRFYETAINYCHMIARYSTDHKEFQIQGISNICDSIRDFSDFKNKLLTMLSGISVDKNKYDIFIKMHLTTTWLEDFNQILKEI